MCICLSAQCAVNLLHYVGITGTRTELLIHCCFPLKPSSFSLYITLQVFILIAHDKLDSSYSQTSLCELKPRTLELCSRFLILDSLNIAVPCYTTVRFSLPGCEDVWNITKMKAYGVCAYLLPVLKGTFQEKAECCTKLVKEAASENVEWPPQEVKLNININSIHFISDMQYLKPCFPYLGYV